MEEAPPAYEELHAVPLGGLGGGPPPQGFGQQDGFGEGPPPGYGWGVPHGFGNFYIPPITINVFLHIYL